MGSDAHTASLFPGEPLIDDRQKIALAVYVEKLSRWRVTLSPGVLLATRNTASSRQLGSWIRLRQHYWPISALLAD